MLNKHTERLLENFNEVMKWLYENDCNRSWWFTYHRRLAFQLDALGCKSCLPAHYSMIEIIKRRKNETVQDHGTRPHYIRTQY